jgi:hypothetical protein
MRFEDVESVKEELLFYESLLGRTTTNDILKKLDQFTKVDGTECKKRVSVFAWMEHVQ